MTWATHVLQWMDLLGYDFEAGEDQREAGERLAASYINFYLANHCVLLPRFGDENDTVAAEILGKCFPDRRILPVDARVILTGGGNIHCITQQIPAKKRIMPTAITPISQQ